MATYDDVAASLTPLDGIVCLSTRTVGIKGLEPAFELSESAC